MKQIRKFIDKHLEELAVGSALIFAIALMVICAFHGYRKEEPENALPISNTRQNIADSSVHGDIYLPILVDPDPTIITTVEETEWYVTREFLIDYAAENYGVNYEWTVWLIGTTWNEDYHSDRYLEYAWACEILNVYRNYSVWQLDGIWGDYYSLDNAYSGYYSADYTCLEMVWYAMCDLDTRIVEVDGMIRWDVPGYYLIYDSDIYNCQVWGQ